MTASAPHNREFKRLITDEERTRLLAASLLFLLLLLLKVS